MLIMCRIGFWLRKAKCLDLFFFGFVTGDIPADGCPSSSWVRSRPRISRSFSPSGLFVFFRSLSSFSSRASTEIRSARRSSSSMVRISSSGLIAGLACGDFVVVKTADDMDQSVGFPQGVEKDAVFDFAVGDSGQVDEIHRRRDLFLFGVELPRAGRVGRRAGGRSSRSLPVFRRRRNGPRHGRPSGY